MTLASTNDYWIAPSCLHIGRNAMGDYNKLQCSVQGNAVVMCFVRGVDGLGYDNGHNYQRWPLTAYPTVFHDDVARYVYIAIPKPGAKETSAQVVFPSQMLDIYGCNASGQQIGTPNAFYIWTQGILGPSVVDGKNQPREWQQDIDTGSLATDQAFAEQQQSEWFEYNSITDQVKFLKDIIEATIINLKSTTAKITTAIINTLTLGDRSLTSVAHNTTQSEVATPEDSETAIVTPAYGKEMYVSRQHDDTKQGSLVIKGNLLQGETGDTEPYIGSESFLDELTGHGWRAYMGGRITADSMSLRKFLEVPELRFNRTTITTGVTWHTVGAGIIEEVTQCEYAYEDVETHQRKAAHGMVKLKLEDGEVGAVAYNDLAMGIWHNLGDGATTMNETENRDGHDGNFTFAGFQTIYFRVVALCHKDGTPVEYKSDGTILPHYDSEGNDITCRNQQYFLYELREKKEGAHGWQREFHPVSGMHFACYANRTNSERQACSYQTDTYFVLLAGLTDWTYDGTAIQFLFGDRKGFTIPARRWDTGEEYEHQLVGYGAGMGNVVRWGQDEHINRAPSIVSQQLLWLRSVMSYDELKAMSFKDIVDIHWHQMSVDIPRPTEAEPYLFHRWLITYDDGHTSDGYADEQYYIERHPELLPWLVEEYAGVYILECEYAAMKRTGHDRIVFADGGHLALEDGDVTIDYPSIACRRYNGIHETTDGYLCYSIDNGEEHEYIEPVITRSIKSQITFRWYGSTRRNVLYRSVTVPMVEETWSMIVGGDNVADLPKNQTVTLRAVLRIGQVTATDLFDNEAFTWQRISGTTAESRALDAQWAIDRADDIHKPYIMIADADVIRRAEFKCKFKDQIELEASTTVFQTEDAYSAYLGNPMDTLGVGSNGIYEGMPIEFMTDFHILCGTEEQELTDLRVESVKPATRLVTASADKETGKVTILVSDKADFTHITEQYKIRIEGTCYALTKQHPNNPTYLAAEFVLKGSRDADDGVQYSVMVSPHHFIPVDSSGEVKDGPLALEVKAISSKVNEGVIELTAAQMTKLGLYLSYDVDGIEKGDKVQMPIAIRDIGADIKPKKAVTSHLWLRDKIIDSKDCFVVPDGQHGLSPEIKDGEWWIGDTPTGITATPEDPDAWTIDDEGYWCMNGNRTDPPVSAKGSPGQAVFVSYAFKRSKTVVTTPPTGGDFAFPHPDASSGWSDGIPSGSDPVYISSRCFTSDGKTPQQDKWSTPSLMCDTADIDICYSASETKPAANTLPTQGSNTDNETWHNTASENDVWMAIASKVGGTWGNWQVAKIKGEKGEKGDKPVKGVDYDDGKPGIQGCIIRMRGEWQAGETYINESDLKSDGERYIDIVTWRTGQNGEMLYYKALVINEANKDIEPGKHSRWSEFWKQAEKQEFIATKVLLADNAAIKMTQGQSLLLQCDESTPHITAGASGGTTKDGKHTGTAFWAGADAGNKANAPFNVNHQGELTASKANVSGSISCLSQHFVIPDRNDKYIKPENGMYYMGNGDYQLDFDLFPDKWTNIVINCECVNRSRPTNSELTGYQNVRLNINNGYIIGHLDRVADTGQETITATDNCLINDLKLQFGGTLTLAVKKGEGRILNMFGRGWVTGIKSNPAVELCTGQLCPTGVINAQVVPSSSMNDYSNLWYKDSDRDKLFS